MPYLVESDRLPKFQSGYRSHHSTETLLVRLLWDILQLTTVHEVTVLALLDVSAAFDSVDHNILLQRLRISYGINSRALDWLESFVRDRTRSVQIGILRSEWRLICTGVPLGSVLEPLLYVLFTADVLEVAGRTGAGIQQYADDTQAYRHCKASEAMHALTERVNTITEIKDWMSSNRLKLNPSKTQYIWIGNKMPLAKIDRQALLHRYPGIVFETSVMAVASPAPKKWGGPNHVSLLVSSKSYNIHTWGTPPICEKKLFNGFALIPRGVWTEVGGSGPLHSPPWRRHCVMDLSQGLTIATRSYLASLQYRPNEFREFWMQRLVSCFEFQSSHQRAPLYLQELCVLVSEVPGRRHLRSADQLCRSGDLLLLDRWRGTATRVSIAGNSKSSKIVIKTHLFNTVMKWRLGTISEQSIGPPRGLLMGRWRNKC